METTQTMNHFFILKKKTLAYLFACLFFFPIIAFSAGPQEVPVPGTVTLVDIGADKCIPCKMMAPILEQLREEYKEKAAVVFLDVWKDPTLGKPFNIRTIPTQIFYNKSGKEVWRHEGFLDKETIVEKLESLLKQ